MTTLHQFRPFWGLPNASPFCMKAETYLRYAGIEYTTEVSDPRRSPSKQIPFITTDNTVITDSQKIIEHFESQRGNLLDGWLNDEQRAVAWFIRRAVEEELYWQITYMRWGDPKGWDVFLPDLKQHLPGWKKIVLPYMIRMVLLRQMGRRGMTSKNTDSSYAAGIHMLNMLSDTLEAKPYFMGEKLCSLDMSLYAFLANIIDQPHSNLLQQHARSLNNLVAYCAKIKDEVWGDWQAPH